MEKIAFSKQNSLAIKGVAILMMLWHHCFLAGQGRFEDYIINFWPLTQGQVVNIAAFCKICVSLFAFISGYGLFLSYQKTCKNSQSTTKWISEKIIRTLSSYWFVVCLMWVVCTFLDNRPYRVHGFSESKYLGLWNMCIEFLGLSNFFNVRRLGEDWWYISAAIVFILLLPVIYHTFDKLGCFCTMCMIFILPRVCGGSPGGTSFLSFLPSLCFGMLFAKFDLFAKWADGRRKRADGRVWRVLRRILLLFALLLSYKLYYHLPTVIWWDVKWGIIPLVVILFIYDVLLPIPPLNLLLMWAGKHATNIWLIHAFIRSYYCKDFIYRQGHFVLIIGVLFLTSLGGSLVIGGLKKITRYDALIEKLLSLVRAA